MPDTATTPPRFTHLISDCDGVLIDSEAVALQALLELLGPRLPNLPEGVTLQGLIEPRLGQRLVPLMQDIYKELGLPQLPADDIMAIGNAVDAACDAQLRAVPGVAQALAQARLDQALQGDAFGQVRQARRQQFQQRLQGHGFAVDQHAIAVADQMGKAQWGGGGIRHGLSRRQR